MLLLLLLWVWLCNGADVRGEMCGSEVDVSDEGGAAGWWKRVAATVAEGGRESARCDAGGGCSRS